MFIGFFNGSIIHPRKNRSFPPSPVRSCHRLPLGPAFRGHPGPAARALGRGQVPGSRQGPDLTGRDKVGSRSDPRDDGERFVNQQHPFFSVWLYHVISHLLICHCVVGSISSIPLYPTKYSTSQWDITKRKW